MKKILLINPGHDSTHETYKHVTHRIIHRDPPPLALLYVGTYLLKNGYKVEIIDTHIDNNYIKSITERIQRNDYIFAGMTVIIGKFLKNAREITSLIRRINPNLPVVWGGIMPSIFPDACLLEYKPDYIVRFEGEETCLELARALTNNINNAENIKGISYFKDGKIAHNPARLPKLNLDEYPVPRWELFGKYFNKEQIPYYYLIMSSKGCVYNCKFCYKHSIDLEFRGRIPDWRYRSAKHVIAEIDYIYQKTGTKVYTFGDDNFFVNKNRAIEILEYFRTKGFYIEECIGHLNCLDDDLIGAMGGIVQTFIFSLEAASKKLQVYLNKKFDLDSLCNKIKKLTTQGIVSSISFIVGFPDEREKDLRENIDLMLRLKEINPFVRGNVYFFLPLPKTQLFDEIEKSQNIKLPVEMSVLEDANFWVKSFTDSIGSKLRPWLNQDRFRFLVNYGAVFNDVFKANNLEPNDETRELLRDNPEIGDMFKGIESVKRPKTNYRTYLLDRVLSGETVDLINGLVGK